jgi:SAM-dependent methyltransferase
MTSLKFLKEKSPHRFSDIISKGLSKNKVLKIMEKNMSDHQIEEIIMRESSYINDSFPIKLAHMLQKYYDKNDRVLDYGCGSGAYIKKIGEVVPISPDRCYGVDIGEVFNQEWTESREKHNFIFRSITIEQNRLVFPFSGNFNVITLFMVLHHVPPEHLDQTLSMVHDHLDSNGILLIREHDCRDVSDYHLISAEHFVYNKKWLRIYLHSSNTWESILRKHKFKKVYQDPTSGPDRQYFSIYSK